MSGVGTYVYTPTLQIKASFHWPAYRSTSLHVLVLPPPFIRILPTALPSRAWIWMDEWMDGWRRKRKSTSHCHIKISSCLSSWSDNSGVCPMLDPAARMVSLYNLELFAYNSRPSTLRAPNHITCTCQQDVCALMWSRRRRWRRWRRRRGGEEEVVVRTTTSFSVFKVIHKATLKRCF